MYPFAAPRTTIKLLTSEDVVLATYIQAPPYRTFCCIRCKELPSLGVCEKPPAPGDRGAEHFCLLLLIYLQLKTGTNVTLKRGVQLKTGMSWKAAQLSASWEEICFPQLVSWLLTVPVLQIKWRWMTGLIRKANKNCQSQQESCIMYSFNAAVSAQHETSIRLIRHYSNCYRSCIILFYLVNVCV
jgi:hypothetical protein